MRISDWSSDVCSSDLQLLPVAQTLVITIVRLRKRLLRQRQKARVFIPLRRPLRLRQPGQELRACRIALFGLPRYHPQRRPAHKRITRLLCDLRVIRQPANRKIKLLRILEVTQISRRRQQHRAFPIRKTLSCHRIELRLDTPPGTHPTDNQRKMPYIDRKSVVEGKSVSVRVRLGGSRNIKKKKKKNKNKK